MSFSSSTNSQYFFVKISGIGSRLRRVKDKVLWKQKIPLFWAYVEQPDDHIGWATSMPFASIYSTEIFMKNIESWRCWKMKFCFFVCGYWVFQKEIIFVFSQWKSQWLSYEVAFISALWMVSSESWKRLYLN